MGKGRASVQYHKANHNFSKVKKDYNKMNNDTKHHRGKQFNKDFANSWKHAMNGFGFGTKGFFRSWVSGTHKSHHKNPNNSNSSDYTYYDKSYP